MLARIFPDARFVHLVRHPKGFIRSGLDRSYYQENNVSNVKRINDVEDQNWESLSQYGKIAWLWNETNTFIEKFGQSVAPNRFLLFPFDLTDINGVKKVLEFMQLDITDNKVRSLLNVKKNVQKHRKYPSFEKWENHYQEEVKTICKVQAAKYDFNF